HMVPAAYVRLPGMPLTPNGKLDRKALPAPDGQAYARRVYEAPREGTEASLARIWEAVLQVDRVGRHDNFFELGGNSLLAMSLISRMRQVFGVEVSLRDFFTASTLDGVARTVEASSVDAFSSIDRVSREEPLELSFAQQRLWFLCRMGGASVSRAYHIPAGLTMEGVLDHGALIKALDRIVERHEALRTTFVVVDDKPVQRIGRPDLGFSLQQDDLTARDDAAAELERLAEETFTQPFDLENGPLIRGRLVRLGETRHELLVTMHHIMSDGWSINVLIKELGALYGAYARAQSDPLPVPNVQYADYAAWQRRWVAGDVLQAQSAYWTARLAGVPTLLELPTDRTRPDQQGYTGAQIALTLDESLTARLRALARRSGTTLFMVLLAGWAVVLSKLANQDDVVIGTPVANRTRAELEALIGFFVNTQALRVDLSDRPTVAQLLARVKESVLGAQQHQDLPFEQVVELVNPTRSMAHSPLFQVMFAWQNTEQSPLSLPGLKLQARASDATIAKFDLALSLRESENAIHGSLEYATALFDRETAQRMGEYLRRVLQEMGEKYAQPIGTLSLLSAEERRRLLAEWSETRRAHPEDRCLHELFEEQASRTPEAVAVVFEGARLSYGELNARSNRVARYLRRQGIGPDQRVAICVERSLEMTVSLLGVLKAGAAYVPLDPSYPADRLAYMLADSAPAVLVTQQSLLDSMPGLAQAHDTLLIDACDDESDADLPPLATSAHLAYVIYTSGSTGRPKGVTVTHRNVARLFEATQANFGFSGGDVWTLFHSFAFDFSVWEMWGAWLTGGRLVIVPKAVAQSAEAFYMLLCDAGVTVLNQTPGAFRQLIAAQRTSNAGHRLRHVVFGGEALNTAMLKPWYDDSRNAGTLLVNMYGITETTVHVSYRPLTPEDAMRAGYSPIGRPLDDLGAYLLDDAFEPVPPGVAGELYIAGAGLARGYLNRADLTASRFVPDPFGAPGGRLYRTGDLARRVADGGIEYLGRNDEQVKLRGFRIEPGEIAAKLIQHPSVDDAVVLARDDGHDGKRLVGYYTVRAEDAGTSLSGETLRAHLRAELPDYMVPAAYVKLDAWPLTSNGKLDRRALPAPDDDAYARRVYEAPQGETEMVLARIWSDVLGVERVGRHDNFFELGGHSLLALSLTEQMREANLHVDIRMLFSAPTLAALAEAASDTPEQTVVVPPNLIRSAPLDKAPTDARRRTVELRI
ncbi:amino acid adenylation domain-containing protein, partial [Burkholderia stagnalis]